MPRMVPDAVGKMAQERPRGLARLLRSGAGRREGKVLDERVPEMPRGVGGGWGADDRPEVRGGV